MVRHVSLSHLPTRYCGLARTCWRVGFRSTACQGLRYEKALGWDAAEWATKVPAANCGNNRTTWSVGSSIGKTDPIALTGASASVIAGSRPKITEIADHGTDEKRPIVERTVTGVTCLDFQGPLAASHGTVVPIPAAGRMPPFEQDARIGLVRVVRVRT